MSVSKAFVSLAACLFCFVPVLSDAAVIAGDEIENQLPWWSATPAQIEAAFCKTKKAPTVTQMKSWLEKQSESDETRLSQVVNGVQFRNEKIYYIHLFNDLNSYIWGAIRPIEYKTDCQEFYCAMADIFGGEKRAIQMAYLLARYGYNTNHFVKPKSRVVSEWVDIIKPWSTEHLDTILQAFGDLPRTVPVTDYNRDFKFIDGLQENNDRIMANAVVYIFRPWKDLSHYEKQSTVVHEIGHNFDVNLSKRIGRFWSEVPGEKISRYAKTNAAEDFAESVVGYRYNPQMLRTQAPEKYEIIKNYVFDGVEYLSRDTCRLPSSSQKYAQEAEDLFVKNKEAIEQQLNSRQVAEFVGKELVKVCGDAFLSQQKANGDYKYRRCVTRHMRDIFGDYLLEHANLLLSVEPQVNVAMYKKVKLPMVFVLRAITQFKVSLRSMVTDLITHELYSGAGLSLHLAGQLSDVKAFCSSFSFSNMYYLSRYPLELQIESTGYYTIGHVIEQISQNICTQLYKYKRIRTPAEKASIMFAVDDYLE